MTIREILQTLPFDSSLVLGREPGGLYKGTVWVPGRHDSRAVAETPWCGSVVEVEDTLTRQLLAYAWSVPHDPR